MSSSSHSFTLIILTIAVILLTLNGHYSIFAFDLTFPTFPDAKFRSDTSNATEVFIKDSIDQIAKQLEPPSLALPYNIDGPIALFAEVVGVLSNSDTYSKPYVKPPDVISNSTHEMLNIMMTKVLNRVETALLETKYDKLVIALVIELDKDLEVADCNISPIIPIEISKKLADITVYLTINGHSLNMKCGGDYLFSSGPDSNWNIVINRAVLSNIYFTGNYVFKKVEFLAQCEISASSFLVFIKSKTLHTLYIPYISAIKELIFIDSVMDKLRVDFIQEFHLFLASNSLIGLGMFDCEIKNVWLYNSKVYLEDRFIIESSDQFILFNSTIQSKNSPIQMRIEYSKLIFIDGFKNSHTPIMLSLSHSISVVMKNILLNSATLQQESLLNFRGIKSLSIYSSIFKENNANRIIDISDSSEVDIKEILFEENSATDSPICISPGGAKSSHTRIVDSVFNRNKAGNKAVIALSHPIILARSVFNENEGVSGGAIYFEAGFTISGSTFKKNKAKNGGALYIHSEIGQSASGTMENVDFVENQVTDLDDVKVCGQDSCDGSGGAIYYNQNDLFSIMSCNFVKNLAVRGGAIFANFENDTIFITYSKFKENYASYGGGAIYSNSASYLPLIYEELGSGNKAKVFGDYVASSIASVNWRVQVEDQKDRLYEGNQTISVYPGQLFTIIPYFTDLYNNSFVMNKEVSKIKVSGSNFTISQSSDKEFTNLFIASTGPLPNSEHLHMTTLTISFYKTETNLKVQLLPCPKNFYLKDNQFSKNLVCVYEESREYLIAVAVSVTIVVITLLLCSIGVISMLCYKISHKVKYWMRRDKAEKEIEKRLLESDLCPEEELHSVRNLNFVISIDQITLERKIGEGGSGIVYLGKWHHHPVAVKCLKLQDAYQNSDEIEKEAALLCKLRHPNIVLFFGVSLTPQKQYLIVEYLEKGSLEKHISLMKRNHQFEFVDKLKLLIDITCGMAYLHSLKVIHRDLKPGNILLDSVGVAKVCDFGISRIAGNTAANSTTICAGTLTYMAPELLQSDAEKNRITTSVDVYSFSIIMYEIFFEEAPYAKSLKIKQFKQERNGKIHNSHSEDGFYNNHHLVTPFSVISKVIKGVRPEIPFENPQDIAEWLQLYMFEYGLLSDICKSKAISIVNDYVELMKACWSAEPDQRPNFETVLNCLSLLRQQFMDLTDYHKQISGSLSSTSTTTTTAYD